MVEVGVVEKPDRLDSLSCGWGFRLRAGVEMLTATLQLDATAEPPAIPNTTLRQLPLRRNACVLETETSDLCSALALSRLEEDPE